MSWSIRALSPRALPVSASRRTDIPALFAPWFARRLQEGVVEYIPAGPPRHIRRSLRPEDVLWFNFWSKWPRPFLRALDEVLDAGFPVLWNVTITGLGGTDIEPGVPRPERVVEAVRALARRVPPAAIQWRYDPVLLTGRWDEAWHVQTFTRLADALAGSVDRVALSFVSMYGRRVAPDLRRWQTETGDVLITDRQRQAALVRALSAIAGERGLPTVICCDPWLRDATALPAAGCNDTAWARRVYPDLRAFRPPRSRPTRAGCTCGAEVDIGVYDCCVLGCRYSYGSCDPASARARHARHDPTARCILS